MINYKEIKRIFNDVSNRYENFNRFSIINISNEKKLISKTCFYTSEIGEFYIIVYETEIIKNKIL